MNLYYHPISGCARRVLAFVDVYSIPTEKTLVRLEEGAHKAPDYLALNPNGRVPTLVDEDLILWESLAILRYCARKYKEEALGGTPQDQAKVDQWSIWGIAHMGAACAALNAETFLKKMRGGSPDPAMVEKCTKDVQSLLDLLGNQLENHSFIVGEAPTIADFVIAPHLESTLLLSGMHLENTQVKEWLERMQALPHWPALPRMHA